MRNSVLDLKVLILLCISFVSTEMYGQLGFCQGNSGDPIFTETFGAGLQDFALPAGYTTYTYANGADPHDGIYTVSSNSNYFDWFDVDDHTPNDTNGRMLIVNSSFAAGEFYRTTINGLCENTTYEFSAWLINLLQTGGFCGATAIPINVKFEIWDTTDTLLLASGTTGNINGVSSNPQWNQHALVFQSTVGQTSVILKMINNAPGGCGNDLAIDDIVFKSCGDSIEVNDGTSNNSVTICSSQAPFSDTITALPDNVVFNNHFYQWQLSTDGLNWVDIAGETNASLGITGIVATTYFRAKVAEYAANLNNSDCITFSDIYEIIVNQAPPPPTIECWEIASFDDSSCSWTVTGIQPTQPTGLACWETTVFNSTTCVWDTTGTQPIQPTLECWETATFNTTTCSWDITGNQPTAPTGLDCWETATFNDTTCIWEVTGTQPVQPTLECWESTVFNTTTCIWDITGTQPIQPTTECWETATFNNITCSWEVTGNQPIAPTGLECWETTIFNNTTCIWDISGMQPIQPTLECWETATFNNTSCGWEVTGTQPVALTGLECWEIAIFNNTTCAWEVSGTQPGQPTLECWETAVFNTTTCIWDISGTQPIQPAIECWETVMFNDTTCTWDISGTQPAQPTLECWQTATFNNVTCSWDVTGTQPVDFIEESIVFCEGDEVTMQADSDLVTPTFLWNTGEMTEFKTVDVAGIYVVVISDGCSTIEKTITVEEIPNPIIESVESDGSSIIISTTNSGDFEYSLDGFSFQSSPLFSGIDGGPYTIYVKVRDCNTVVTTDHFHFYIPKFISPNDDGINDFFTLRGIEYFESSEVSIYNRYGKLLYHIKNTSPFWDGTFNNLPLPTNDYWYVIILGGKKVTGHFTLKR